MSIDLQEFVAEDGWLLVGIATFALAGLASVAGLGGVASGIAVLGWFLLAPILLFWGDEVASLLFDEEEPERASTESDAIEVLKRRYATGEIDEAELERRLERLVGVEALEGVRTAGSTGEETPRERERGREASREPTPERERET